MAVLEHAALHPATTSCTCGPAAAAAWLWAYLLTQIAFTSLQISSAISPLPSLTLPSLLVDVAPGLMNASANGVTGNAPVTIQFTSTTANTSVTNNTSNSSSSSSQLWIGYIKVSSAGASLTGLLSSLSESVSNELGLALPDFALDQASNDASAGGSSAELLFDSVHGLRMLNISMGSTRLGLADLAGLLGFDLQDAGDPVSFTNAWLYLVPVKQGAPVLQWMGKAVGAVLELGVSASVDVPSLGISNVTGALHINGTQSLLLQVGADS